MLTQFLRDHILPVTATIAGAVVVALGMLSDLYALSASGIPWHGWVAGGATTLAVSATYLAYRVYRQAALLPPHLGPDGPIRPDVSFFQAIYWRANGAWLPAGEPRYALSNDEFQSCLADLTERARAGQLTLWGRARKQGLTKADRKAMPKPRFERIPQGYLKFSELRIVSPDAASTKPLSGARLFPESYFDLMTSSHEVMALWPRKPIEK